MSADMAEGVFNGPGRYADQCTAARAGCQAKGIVLLVYEGTRGPGFEVQGPLEMIRQLPEVLRDLAEHIEGQLIQEGFRRG